MRVPHTRGACARGRGSLGSRKLDGGRPEVESIVGRGSCFSGRSEVPESDRLSGRPRHELDASLRHDRECSYRSDNERRQIHRIGLPGQTIEAVAARMPPERRAVPDDRFTVRLDNPGHSSVEPTLETPVGARPRRAVRPIGSKRTSLASERTTSTASTRSIVMPYLTELEPAELLPICPRAWPDCSWTYRRRTSARAAPPPG